MGIEGFGVGWSKIFDIFQNNLVQTIIQWCIFHVSFSILTFCSANQNVKRSEQSFIDLQFTKAMSTLQTKKIPFFLRTVNKNIECSYMTYFEIISSPSPYSKDMTCSDICHTQIVQITIINMQHDFFLIWWVCAQTYAILTFKINFLVSEKYFMLHWSKTLISFQSFQIFKHIYCLKSLSWLYVWW